MKNHPSVLKEIFNYNLNSTVQDCVIFNKKHRLLCDSDGNNGSSPALIAYNNMIRRKKTLLWNLVEYNRNLRLEIRYNQNLTYKTHIFVRIEYGMDKPYIYTGTRHT